MANVEHSRVASPASAPPPRARVSPARWAGSAALALVLAFSGAGGVRAGGADTPPGAGKKSSSPRVRSGPVTETERAFWAFQPITDPAPPVVRGEAEGLTAIDRFVLARLETAGLHLRPPADRRALLRRATFDLTGLPPSPAEIDAFLADTASGAFERVVERLLAAPGYGERWGRHWLDVVRYADTAGETADYPTPLAYKYRNWVIEAVRRDMPFDKFLEAQIAGDLLGRRVLEGPDGPLDVDKLGPEALEEYRSDMVATGFLAISRRFGFDVENYHYLTIQDTIDTIGQAVLGLTLGCARCHDHKFDPVNMDDYYAWYGIFESTRYSFPGSEEKKRPYDAFPSVPPTLAKRLRADLDSRVGELDAEIGRLDEERGVLARKLEAIAGAPGYHGFEVDPVGQPPQKPWGHVAGALLVAEAQSPFTNLFPSGSRGVNFPGNGENNAIERTLDAVYAAQAGGKLHYAADFRNVVPARGDGAYRFYLGHGPGKSAAMELAASASSFLVKNGGAYETVRALVPGSWYQVQVTLDLATRTYSGSVGAPGDVVAFEGKAFSEGWDGTIDYTFVDRFGPGGGALPAHQVDNVLVSTAALPSVGTVIDRPEERASLVRSLGAEADEIGRRRLDLIPRREALRRTQPHEVVYGAIDRDAVGDAKLQLRGEPRKPGDVVPRRNLDILGRDPLPPGAGSGRLELAHWLTRPSNPLTARVLANRIWQHHFGRGLVGTENDFGTRGERPSHPELLDWLASRLGESGWSLKALHRIIMTSLVYQQSSEEDLSAAEVDPEGRLLWRFNPRRLSAEEIRDAMLLVSGDLDLSMGGEHPFPPVETWGFTQHGPFYGVYPTLRRSVYLMQQRLKRHPFLALFDGADTNVSTARRQPTTVPTQALFLMNNEFVFERARSLARVALSTGGTGEDVLTPMFLRALGRPPTGTEIAEIDEFVAGYPAPAAGLAEDARRLEAWSAVARTLLIRNEFLFVD